MNLRSFSFKPPFYQFVYEEEASASWTTYDITLQFPWDYPSGCIPQTSEPSALDTTGVQLLFEERNYTASEFQQRFQELYKTFAVGVPNEQTRHILHDMLQRWGIFNKNPITVGGIHNQYITITYNESVITKDEVVSLLEHAFEALRQAVKEETPKEETDASEDDDDLLDNPDAEIIDYEESDDFLFNITEIEEEEELPV